MVVGYFAVRVDTCVDCVEEIAVSSGGVLYVVPYRDTVDDVLTVVSVVVASVCPLCADASANNVGAVLGGLTSDVSSDERCRTSDSNASGAAWGIRVPSLVTSLVGWGWTTNAVLTVGSVVVLGTTSHGMVKVVAAVSLE